MLTFLTENLATIIIAVIVIGILAAIITKMIKDKKKVNPPAAVDVRTALHRKFAIKRINNSKRKPAGVNLPVFFACINILLIQIEFLRSGL